MSGPDWCRFYPAKWLTGTFCLSNEQRGVYIQVVAVIMDRGECPADFRYLGRICNLRSHCVKRIVGELIEAGKLVESGSKLHQNRAETERELALNLTETQRLKALKGWQTRQLAVANRQSQPQPQPQPQPEKKEDSRSNGAAKPDLDAEFVNYFWPAWTAPARKIAKGQAREAYRTARRKNVAMETIMAGLKRSISEWRREARAPDKTPHPATWLNGERWEDEPKPSAQPPPARSRREVPDLMAYSGEDYPT